MGTGFFESQRDTEECSFSYCGQVDMSNPVALFLSPSVWCLSWILMWTPFRGSLSVKSDDVRTSRKRLVSCNHRYFTLSTFLVDSFCLEDFLFGLPDLLYLVRFSWTGDQTLPDSTHAGSAPRSVPDTVGPTAPWTHRYRGREREAGKRAQRSERLC